MTTIARGARPWSIPRFKVSQLASGQMLTYNGRAFVNDDSTGVVRVLTHTGPAVVTPNNSSSFQTYLTFNATLPAGT